MKEYLAMKQLHSYLVSTSGHCNISILVGYNEHFEIVKLHVNQD